MSSRKHERGWYLTRMFSLKNEVKESILDSDLGEHHTIIILNSIIDEMQTKKICKRCDEELTEAPKGGYMCCNQDCPSIGGAAE